MRTNLLHEEGTRDAVIERSIIEEAERLWRNRDSLQLPEYTSKAMDEELPRSISETQGTAPTREDRRGVEHIHGSRIEMDTSTLQGPEPYGPGDKWIALASVRRLDTESRQQEMLNAIDGSVHGSVYDV